MNIPLTRQILQEIRRMGVSELCLCPGARNAPFIALLSSSDLFRKYYWFEERSAAFFAMGRARALEAPAAVITTSGTAAGELLPAAMEAYYSGAPLVHQRDRPRRFRGTGAPQSAEQVGLLGKYSTFSRGSRCRGSLQPCFLEAPWSGTSECLF